MTLRHNWKMTQKLAVRCVFTWEVHTYEEVDQLLTFIVLRDRLHSSTQT